jgi:hypothetical protein
VHLLPRSLLIGNLILVLVRDCVWFPILSLPTQFHQLFILLPLHILHVYEQWVCNQDSNSKLLDLPHLNLQLLNQPWSVASAELSRPRPQARRYLVLYRQPQKYYTRSFVQLGSSNTCGIQIQRRCVIGNRTIASVFTKPGVEVPVLSWVVG